MSGSATDLDGAAAPVVAGTARRKPTTTKHLEKLGIARETTGRKNGRLHACDISLNILNEGTEPLK
jgi:hypothetical protein